MYKIVILMKMKQEVQALESENSCLGFIGTVH